VQAIERRARVPVQLFDPIVNLSVDSKFVDEPQLRATSAQMVVALGLSLRCDRERRQWSV
jgi:type IV pilus assembly protein PilM